MLDLLSTPRSREESICQPKPFEFPVLTRYQKNTLLQCAEKLLQAQQQIVQQTEKNILHYTLAGKKRHKRMQHYPADDRIDMSTGAQYFYHCHRENKSREEHGHFHCFLRYHQIPKRIKPAALADWDKHIENPMTHLVAIGMNRYGEPIRLFTVNRWISSEIWYDAHHAPELLKRFKMTLVDAYWELLDQWVENFLQLFAPQIAWLHQTRDATLALHQQQNPSQNVYEDPAIEEPSEIFINLKTQIEWILN